MLKIARGLGVLGGPGLLGLVMAATVMWTAPVSALSEALARKCLDIALKEFPRPRNWTAYRPGNPTTALARQAYYRECIARDGNMADPRPGPPGADGAASPRP